MVVQAKSWGFSKEQRNAPGEGDKSNGLERGDPMRNCRFGCFVPKSGANAVVSDVCAKSSVLAVVQISVLRTGP